MPDAECGPSVSTRALLPVSRAFWSLFAFRYGFSSSSASLAQVASKVQLGSSSGDASRTVLSLEDVLDAPLPPCPLEPSLRAHWLAANGVQPVIEENPSQSSTAPPAAAAATAAASALLTASSAPAPHIPAPASATAASDASATKDVSQELFLFFEKVLPNCRTRCCCD